MRARSNTRGFVGTRFYRQKKSVNDVSVGSASSRCRAKISQKRTFTGKWSNSSLESALAVGPTTVGGSGRGAIRRGILPVWSNGRDHVTSLRMARRFAALWLLLALVAAVASAEGEGSLPGAQSDVLLVVGTVTETTARVLYQPLLFAPTRPSSYVVLRASGGEPEQRGTLDFALARTTPRILALSGLARNTSYVVVFFDRFASNELGRVAFRTFADAHGKDVELAVVSCSRFNEDGDESMWRQFSREATNRTATLHLGDQVYMDWVTARLSKLDPLPCARVLERMTCLV